MRVAHSDTPATEHARRKCVLATITIDVVHPNTADTHPVMRPCGRGGRTITEAQLTTHNRSVVAVPQIVGYSAPLAIMEDLHSPLVSRHTTNQTHCALDRGHKQERRRRPRRMPRKRRRRRRRRWNSWWRRRRKRIMRATVRSVAKRRPRKPVSVRSRAAAVVRAGANVDRLRIVARGSAGCKAHLCSQPSRPHHRMACLQPTAVLCATRMLIRNRLRCHAITSTRLEHVPPGRVERHVRLHG